MKKVIGVRTWVALTALAGTSLLSAGQSASAQEASSSSSTRFSVDLKDATLRDALELVFQAAGNPSHIIDPAASQVRIGAVSFKDQEWRDIVRTLANLNKFRFRRESGAWIVDPRSSAQRSRGFGTTTTTSFQIRDKASFSVETRSNRQFGGGIGGAGGAGGIGGTGSLSKPIAIDSNNPWSIIEPLHLYAGAIALFFQGGTVVSSEAFIVPSNAFISHAGGALVKKGGTSSGIGGNTGTSTGGTGGTGGNTGISNTGSTSR